MRFLREMGRGSPIESDKWKAGRKIKMTPYSAPIKKLGGEEEAEIESTVAEDTLEEL